MWPLLSWWFRDTGNRIATLLVKIPGLITGPPMAWGISNPGIETSYDTLYFDSDTVDRQLIKSPVIT